MPVSVITPYIAYTAPPSYAEPLPGPSYNPLPNVVEPAVPSVRVTPRPAKGSMTRVAGG